MQLKPIPLITILAFAAFTAHAADEWIPLFDGKSLDGWKSNEEKPGCFTITDEGALKVSGGRAHLFYVGKDGKASFKDFEVKAEVKTTPGSNSGFYIHTEYQEKGWPSKGYEAQINSTHKDKRKTGSLYAVKDVLNNAPSKDGEWFEYTIRVEGKRVIIKVDGKVTVDYTEPDNAAKERPQNMGGRLLNGGTFAIQGHDPKSTVYLRNIRVRPL